MARKTVGWNEKGHPKYYYVGYYPTKQEALTALGAFNFNPIYTQEMSMNDVYERWSKEHFPTISPSLQRTYKNAWSILAPLHAADINAVKLEQLQRVFDASGKNAPMLKMAKIVLNQVYAYAEKYEIVDPARNRLKFLNVNAKNPNKKIKSVIAPEEIQAVWSSDDPFRPYALILLYTGLRASELIDLDREDVDLQKGCLTVKKAKTPTGVRIVPISSKIAPFFAAYKPYYKGYDTLRRQFEAVCPGHTPHEARHTFISRLVEAGVNDRIIKAIVGHKDGDVTSVYTHISLPAMQEAVELLD